MYKLLFKWLLSHSRSVTSFNKLLHFRSGQVRSECLTCRFRTSWCSARLSRAQVPAFPSHCIFILYEMNVALNNAKLKQTLIRYTFNNGNKTFSLKIFYDFPHKIMALRFFFSTQYIYGTIFTPVSITIPPPPPPPMF